MKRRELLQKSAAFSFLAAMPFSLSEVHADEAKNGSSSKGAGVDKAAAVTNPLKPPATGSIPVAFVISESNVLIDFAGPWDVFVNAATGSRSNLFNLYTVAESTKPVEGSGMKIIPDYTFENAPAPKVIVLPAQSSRSEALLEWIRKSSKNADVTMSVCDGAYLLAATGLLAGKSATAHHGSYIDLALKYPNIKVKRGARFVEDGNLASSGGLSSGIDLAFRVVERYFGREAAKSTAYNMEYQGQGWMDPNSNSEYLKMRASTDEHPLCAVCGMDADAATSPRSIYKGKTYHFCSQAHKEQFDATPEKVIEMLQKK